MRPGLLMGGILINSDHDAGSFCAPRRFVWVDQTQERSEDLLPELMRACGRGA